MEKKLKVDYNLQYSSFTFHNFMRNDALYGLLVFSRNFLVFSIKYFLCSLCFCFSKQKNENQIFFFMFSLSSLFLKKKTVFKKGKQTCV